MPDLDDWAQKPSPPRKQSVRELDVLQDTFQEFSQLQTARSVFAGQWEEVAELIAPNFRNTFFYGSYRSQGQKLTERQIDASGMMALSRFGAICDSLSTPRNSTWHGLEASDSYVMKDRDTRLWFEQATKILFKQRYAPHANFTGQNQANYRSLGAFGTGAMFTDSFDGANYGRARGLRYKSIPLGELFIRENHQGVVDGFIRWFRLTARQCLAQWGKDKFPDALKPALVANSEQTFDFLHRVMPRGDYDPDMLDERGKPFGSWYVCIAARCIMQEGGYHTFPLSVPRYAQYPGEVYGRGPAMDVLPALKTLNAEKRIFLKQGHRAGDPVLLTADDGLTDGMSLKPGALNKGGVTAEGRELVKVLPTGNIQITKEMMDEEKSLINDTFLVSLFQIMTETPQMTATEVIERINEKGILIAPTVGALQDNYIGPMIDRELDLLSQLRMLPPMPPRLLEAGGSYDVVHTSPMAKLAKSGSAAGFMRTLESVKELVAITGDQSLLDPFDFDVAVPEIADIQSVPASWMATDGQIAQKRKARAEQQAAQQKVQALPAQAAMMKAQAVAAKAGGMPGQLPAEGGPPLAQQMGG